LTEAFKLGPSSVNDQIKPDLLVDIFRSLEQNELPEARTDSAHGAISDDAPSSSSAQNAADAKLSEPLNSPVCSPSFRHTYTHINIYFYILF
jgi:hypothetical protein